MKQRLETQVATAVGALLVGRESVTLTDLNHALPHHIRAANPSPRSLTKALTGAGWVAHRGEGGRVWYEPAPPEGEEPAPIGHNRDDAAADELRLLIERIERLDEEKKGLAGDRKDVMAEAKSRGYDPRALAQVIRIRGRKKEEHHEQEAVLEVYMRALGMME